MTEDPVRGGNTEPDAVGPAPEGPPAGEESAPAVRTARLDAIGDDHPAEPALARVDYEPPWREAHNRIAAAWARGGTPTRIALGGAILVAAALLGAFVFGLWHVVVGGFVKGNWNAAGFGFALSGAAGVLLWMEAAIARRLLPAAPST
jgi:hypothetical protein